ncbi:MAG: MFS transporter [Microthrixaceae bacterium]
MLSGAAVAVGQGFSRFSLGLLMPPMTRDILHSYTKAGWLGTTNLAAYLIGMLVVSFLSTRMRQDRLVQISLLGTVASFFILFAAPDYTILILGMALNGFCSAGLWVPLAGVVSAAVKPERRGLALGLVVAGFGLGVVIASQLVGVVRSAGGADAWRPVWLIEGVIGVVVLIGFAVAFRPLLSQPEGPQTHGTAAFLAMPRGWAITISYAAFGFGLALFSNFLVTALEEDSGFSPNHASRVFSLLGFASVFGGVLLGRWSDRTGRRLMLMLGTSTAAACTLAVLAGIEPLVSLAAVAFGFCMSGTGALVSAVVSDGVDPNEVGAVFGVITVMFGIAQAVGPYAGGWIAESTGSFSAVFVVSGAAFILSLIASSFVPPRRTDPQRAPLPPGPI